MATPASGKAAGGKAQTLWIVSVGAVVVAILGGYLVLSEAPEQAMPQPTVSAPAAAPQSPATPDVAAAPVAPETATAPSAAPADAAVAPVAPPAPADAATPAAETATAPATAPVAETATTTPTAAAPATTTAAAATADPATAPTAAAPAPEPEPAPAPAPVAIAPSFDLVRVDAEGRALAAGRAEPGARVTLRLDGVDIKSVTADRAGNFVAMMRIEPSDRPRVLSLEAVGQSGVPQAGDETAMIAPFALPAPAPAEAAPPAATAAVETAPTADAAATDQAADTQEAPAPAIVVAGSDGLRVLQGADATADGPQPVQIDAISYDADGAVTLAGRGPVATGLRVLLDGREIETGGPDASGQWSLDLSAVAPGTYGLRIEHLDAAGQVIAALDTPFRREDPARIRANPMLAEPGSSVIAVQRGFTLWGIAEANFGSGFLYVQIFQENRDAIRDPDLIYPGQIFALPDLPRTGSAP